MGTFFKTFTKQNMRAFTTQLSLESRQRTDSIARSSADTHALLGRARVERQQKEAQRTVEAGADRAARQAFCQRLRSEHRRMAVASQTQRWATATDLAKMAGEYRAAAAEWKNRWPSRRPVPAPQEQNDGATSTRKAARKAVVRG